MSASVLTVRYMTGKSTPHAHTSAYSCLYLIFTFAVRAAASATLYLWDMALTLDEEVQYIWQRNKRDPSRLCFLGIRYTTASGLVLLAYCRLRRVFFAFGPR